MARVRSSRPARLAALAAALLGLSAGPAVASSATVTTENVEARLIAGAAQAAPGATVPVLLHQSLRPGWHTYWLNPGDSGQATTIEWLLPAGVEAGPIRWAAPERIDLPGLVSYGYEGEVGLLSEITLPADWPAGQALTIRAEARWLVCAEVCIPEAGSFEIVLTTGTETLDDPAAAALFERARRAIPAAAPWPAHYRLGEAAITLEIALPGLDTDTPPAAQFFPRDWGLIDHAAPQAVGAGPEGLRLTLRRGDLAPEGPLAGVLSLDGGETAVWLEAPELP